MGDVLLSHTLARAVPSGLRGLTSVFGMGTGGTPPVWPPGTCSVSSEKFKVRSFFTTPHCSLLTPYCFKKTMSIRSKVMMLNRTTD